MTAISESALGPSHWYYRRMLERSKGWSADQIGAHQGRRSRRYGDGVRSGDAS